MRTFILFSLFVGTVVFAQPPTASPLTRGLQVLVAVETPRGLAPVAHCRGAGAIPAAVASGRQLETREAAWARCTRRLEAFARLFELAGEAHHVDPYLLAAMAFQESGLFPFAQGAAGEGGIAQLHPRGTGRRVRFIQDETYQARCQHRVDACQHEIVLKQAEHLRHWIDRCDGNVKAALGGYNRGQCGITAYTSNVWRHYLRLQVEASTPEEPGA